MKKLTFALAAATALIAAPALAADLRPVVTKAPPTAYVAAPALLWNGFYVGAQVGYQSSRDHVRESVTATGAPSGLDTGLNSYGIVGGLHAGYNFQTGPMVFGIEGDIEASGVDGRYTPGATGGTPMTATLGNLSSFDSRWQGSLRGRVGAAFGPAMLYVTGGLAFADLNYSYTNAATAVTESFRSTEAGWTVGTGVEWALMNNLSARLEYRYTDFGSVTNASTAAFAGSTYDHDPHFHTVRLGVSYRFGGAGPVMARY